jgi:hypothetical protein
MSLLSASDTIYALRFLRLLTQEWEETTAYQTGVIDASGNTLVKKNLSKEQKDSYTLFHRLVFNIKRLLPKNKIASYASALFLIKEHTALSHDVVVQIIEDAGGDIGSVLNESYFIKNDRLLPGVYELKQTIISPKTGEVIGRAGTAIEVKEGLDPVDRMCGRNIYKVRHMSTNQRIYISQEDITK